MSDLWASVCAYGKYLLQMRSVPVDKISSFDCKVIKHNIVWCISKCLLLRPVYIPYTRMDICSILHKKLTQKHKIKNATEPHFVKITNTTEHERQLKVSVQFNRTLALLLEIAKNSVGLTLSKKYKVNSHISWEI